MPFDMVSGVGRGMGVLDGVLIVKEGTVWGEFWASHYKRLEFSSVLMRQRRALLSQITLGEGLVSSWFVCCLQCFDAVGWPAGRASGL